MTKKIQNAICTSFFVLMLKSHSFGLKCGHFRYHQLRKCPNSKNKFVKAQYGFSEFLEYKVLDIFSEPSDDPSAKIAILKVNLTKDLLKTLHMQIFAFLLHAFVTCSSETPDYLSSQISIFRVIMISCLDFL